MTVRIGIIGTGLIGRDHTRRIQQVLAGAEVVALNDVDRKGAKSVQGELAPAARIYDTGRELIAAEDVDAVVVTSWGETHEEYVRASIAADKPCFCEKPLASTAAGARRIVDDEIALGKRLVQVGFMRRYDESYRLLKKAVDTEIGTPLIVHAAHRNATVPDRYVTTMAIHDTLIHEIDIFRWLLDDDYISAQVVFPRKTSNAHDRVADPQIVLLETRKGVRIDVEIFVNCQYGYDIQCQVVGEEGLANLPEPMAVVTRKNARLSQPLLTDWQDRFIDSYDVELRDFIEAAARGRVSGPSGWDGYIAAICADACVEAQNHSGKIIPIALPDCPALYS